MYHSLDISPSLPEPVREMSIAAIQGDYGKVIVCYDEPWWRSKGYNGLVMSYSGPIALVKDTSVETSQHYALTCFVNGEECRDRWSKLEPSQRWKVVLDQLAFVFDDDQALKPIDYFDRAWKDDEYSKGCLCPVLALGHLTKYGHMYGRPAGNIHFVGTEYAKRWKGHMEGALDSGKTGAKEVQAALVHTNT